jgi:hypothetical protein
MVRIRARLLGRLRAIPAIAAWVIAWGVWATLAAPEAAASTGRVVVIDVDPRVIDALVVALSPWSLTVVRAPGPSPTDEIDAATARARGVAAEEHAGAVVWIAAPRAPESQATLWVYDAETLELSVRPLSVSAPFDDVGAAAVALSVKTILRDSPLLAQEALPALPTAPVLAAPPPASPAGRAPASPGPFSWRFETVLGVRAPTGSGAAVEPRAAIGASLWPATLGGHAGLGLQLQAGSGVSVGKPDFQGELRGASLEVTVRLRAPARPWLAFELQVGPALWLTSLDGQALDSGATLHAVRVDPALDAGAVADLALAAHVGLGLALGGSALLRFQRYALDGAPLFTEPTWVGVFGLRLSVEVD